MPTRPSIRANCRTASSSPLSSERVLYRLDIFDTFSTQLESPDETVTGAARFAGGTVVSSDESAMGFGGLGAPLARRLGRLRAR